LALVPPILELGQKRIRSQTRLLRWAALVGVVSGLGAVVFYLAAKTVEHYALGALAGYVPNPQPGGEPPLYWLGHIEGALNPLVSVRRSLAFCNFCVILRVLPFGVRIANSDTFSRF
jgi:hypothetical protein